MADYTRILLRQGPETDRNSVVLRLGEPAWVTDYQRIVVGDGLNKGGVSIGSKFLGFVTFDDISTEVFDVVPGYPGDFVFENSTNLLYVLSGSETILGKKAYQIKTNYVPINKTPSPDELTITGGSGYLSVAQDGIDARYIAPYAFGRGLERDPNNSAIIRMRDTAPELTFINNRLSLTEGGVKFSKLEPLFANQILGALGEGGTPTGYPLDSVAAALRPFLTGEIDGITLGVPVGTIIDFAGPDTSVPANYLPCDGRELEIIEYIELNAVLKGTWGSTVSTFNLPNLNKRATIGAGEDTIGSALSSIGTTVGSYGGSESVRLSQRNLPKHIHGINFTIPAHNHKLTVNLPQFVGAYESGNIVVDGFNNYITIIGGSGPQAAPRTAPAGPVDELSNLRAEAAQIISSNKAYIQGRVVDFVYSNFPWALSSTYTDSQGLSTTPLSAICYRDTGYIVDSLAADLINNANHRSVETGVLYFSGFITKLFQQNLDQKRPTLAWALPDDQVIPTVMAISAIAGFITGVGLPSFQQNYSSAYLLSSSSKFYTDLQKEIIDGLDNYINVIRDKNAAPATKPAGQPPDPSFERASIDILNKKEEIQRRVVDFVQYNFPYALSGSGGVTAEGLSAKCYRDTGFIIDSLAADIKNNANHRSVETGVFYFSGAVLNRASNGNTTVPTLPQDQVFATIQAISAIEGFTTGILMPFERGYTTFGVMSGDIYYNASQVKMLSSLQNFITVIDNPSNVPNTMPFGFIEEEEILNYNNAANQIDFYKSRLQQKIVEYVKSNYPYALSGSGISGDSESLSAKCFRDTGYIVDAITADIRNNTNHRSVEAGQFYFNGAVLARQYNDNSSVPTLPADQVEATIAAISAIGSYINEPLSIDPNPSPIPQLGILPDNNLASLSGKVEELIYTMIHPLKNNGESVSYFPAGSSTNADQYYGYMLIDNKSTIQKAVSSYVFAKKYLRGVNSTAQENMVSSYNNFTVVIDNFNNVPKTNVPGVTDSSYLTAANLIKRYRADLQQQVVEYVKYFYPPALSGIDESISNGLSAKCFRDTGYIIDSIVADMESNVNHRSVETGVFYFSGAVLAREFNEGSSVPTLPVDQVEATIQAISALGKFITGVGEVQPGATIYNILSTGLTDPRKSKAWELIDTMVYPLQNNGAKLDYSPLGAPTEEDIVLGNKLELRRTDIQRSVSAFVLENNFLTFSSELSAELTAKCNRDVGYMVDAIVNDLKTGVNAKSIQYAVAYWDGSTTRIPDSIIPNQQQNTLDTIDFLKQVSLDIANEELTNKCNRDVGYMIDAVSHDLITGVVARSIQYAVAYWDGNTSRIPDTEIDNQRGNTLDTITYLRSAMLDIAVKVSNSVTNRAFKKIKELIKTMIYPLENNGKTLPYQPEGQRTPGSQDIVNLLKTRKEQIQDSVSNYVGRKGYLLFGSDLLAKCRRDVGFMVDSLISNLETGTNAKSIQYALAYWDGSTSRLPEEFIPNQKENTVDSINFLKTYILDIMPRERGIADDIKTLVSTMYYPLLNRGSVLPYRPAGPPVDQDRAFAANVLQSRREDIRQRTIEYVKTLNIINDRGDLQEKCFRDIGYMVDSVINDLRTGVNSQTIQFALAYWTGNANRLGGASSGLNNNVNQISDTIRTVAFLRDYCIDLIISSGGGNTNIAPLSSVTEFNEKFEFFGYTDDGAFEAQPFNNIQPSAVVNKIIKVK